ncbi:MAG: BON domain-containing protein, partial [Pyrinomonadaceae bacterium]
AMTLAREVPGVKQLKDEIQVAPATPLASPEQKPPQEPGTQIPPLAAATKETVATPSPNSSSVEKSDSSSEPGPALIEKSAPPPPRAAAVEKPVLPAAPVEKQTAQRPAPQERIPPAQEPTKSNAELAAASPSAAPATGAPAKLEAEINQAFKNADIRNVSAKVAGDMSVTLNGVAASTAEKDRAFEIATTFKQAKSIDDRISLAENRTEQPKTVIEQKGPGQWSIRK